MKTILGLLSAFLLVALVFSRAEDKQLQFNSNGSFKMVQFTDIHFGESYEEDYNAQQLMANILDWEQPDLVVITGDMVSGYAWDRKQENWYEQQYWNFTKSIREKGYYWATTAGNHDTQADLSREEISELDRSYELSLTKENAGELSHAFNYFLPVYDQSGEEEQFRLWFLDTGEEGCMQVAGYDCVRPDQVDWIREEARKIPKDDPRKGKGFIFLHIPFAEYMNLYNNAKFYGTRGEDICCSSVNTGLFSAILEESIAEWVSVGHDHNNDYYGKYNGVNLAYGRKTGYACYGPKNMQRGARIFEVTQDPYSVKTWVRQEDGSVHVEEEPERKSWLFGDQTRCCASLQKFEMIPDDDEEMAHLKQYYQKRADLQHLIK